MRSSTFSSSASRWYLAALLLALVAAVIAIEFAVRSMPSVYCKAEVNHFYGCSNFRQIKRYFGEPDVNRVFIGDSRLEYMIDYKGFRDYSIPAVVPSEMLLTLKFLLERRDLDRVIIGLDAHHLQNKRRTRTWDVLPDGTFGKQKFPFPIYALEPALTVGLKKYLWDLIFRRPLPKVEGHVMYTDKQLDIRTAERQRKQREANQKGSWDNLRWWQKEPLVLERNVWSKISQGTRNDRARKRFRFFYPHKNYKNIDEHAALIEFLDLIKEQNINACFVRFPQAPEYVSLIQDPKSPRYAEVQRYIISLLVNRDLKFIDTAKLNLGLTRGEFRDADHLLIPTIEALTPAIVESCFPELKSE